MNADRLLTHYERIADAPDAIVRFRRFILDLAVRGKLVGQDSNDEPASELLKRIAAEKARLVKAGEIKKSKAKPVNMSDTPFELPKSWKWTALGDLVLYDAGIKREPKTLNQELWLLELEDVEKDSGRLLVRVTASERESKSTKSEFCVDDILYGKLRPYLNKVLVADVPGYSTTEIVALRSFLPLCSTYCALALRRPDFVGYVTRLGQGTKMPRLRTEDATIAPFPLPPLAEQHRIVAKVNELIALCDRLEVARAEREATRDRLAAASLARLNAPDPDPDTFRNHAAFAFENLVPLTTRLDQIKALRQTILNLAVRGKLVEQDPADEPASELLKRITAEKVGGRKKTKPTTNLTSSITGWDVPQGWVIIDLQSVCASITDGDHLPPPKTESGIPFLVIGNVRSQTIEFAGSRFVSPEYYEALDPIRRPRSGDLLYTLVGSYGIPIVVRDDQPFCVQRHIGILRPSKLIDVLFLARAMESRLVFEQAIACATGIAQKTVPLSGLRRLLIPLAPLAEQHRIVAKVDELMALCDRLEANIATGDNTRCRLLDTLLHEVLSPVADQ